jgi:DNA-binding transcriptional regulator YhcF (GntR family)
MRIRIDDSSERAVYEQIVDKVKLDIALGRLVKGKRLPTVRDLAEQLELAPNTTAKAFRQLEQERIIVTKGRLGAFVSNLKSRITKKMVRKRIERLAVDAYHMGLERGAVVKWLREEVKRLKFPKK